ncbi:MAG: tetratricopeptide repeat protein [Flavobacteriales bacterium]|nr:tetratricopeptide repeat protein [Flavobacteriales bacterium]MCX7768488.1 tetratricopeptide repeat protein [Flavobacteriales bacterium]MDW8409821.1 tetratricopeptide repeat protein [Flavobacteriales bacterium]
MNQKNLLIIFILILWLTCFRAHGQSASKAIREGNEAFRKGDYPTAARRYAQPLKKDPDNPVARFNLGAAYYRMNNYDSLRHHLHQMLKNNPEGQLAAKAWHNLGNSYLAERKPQEAIEAYKNALRLNPEDEDTRYNLAYALRMIPPPSPNSKETDKKKNAHPSQQEKQNSRPQNEPAQKDENNSKNAQRPQPQMSREEADKLLQALLNKEQQKDLDNKNAKEVIVSASGKDW